MVLPHIYIRSSVSQETRIPLIINYPTCNKRNWQSSQFYVMIQEVYSNSEFLMESSHFGKTSAFEVFNIQLSLSTFVFPFLQGLITGNFIMSILHKSWFIFVSKFTSKCRQKSQLLQIRFYKICFPKVCSSEDEFLIENIKFASFKRPALRIYLNWINIYCRCRTIQRLAVF